MSDNVPHHHSTEKEQGYNMFKGHVTIPKRNGRQSNIPHLATYTVNYSYYLHIISWLASHKFIYAVIYCTLACSLCDQSLRVPVEFALIFVSELNSSTSVLCLMFFLLYLSLSHFTMKLIYDAVTGTQNMHSLNDTPQTKVLLILRSKFEINNLITLQCMNLERQIWKD